ncbi:MAG TPA: DNA ligase D [Candidatus Limnocylindria bacterium]|nr:DNA ligase D [Candidatus Limnocylindria bacterium]
MPLDAYRSKRDFARTPEPAPGPIEQRTGRFVVHRHRATRLHYDLRLEVDGVLASWAVPRGPSLDPDQKRLAQRTEDHPIEYLTFEDVIPGGQYGAGDMIVWDWGTFEPEATDDPAAALRGGELKFRLAGERLRGRFTLIHTGGRRDTSGRSSDAGQWLLIHKRDGAAVPGWDAESLSTSVRSGRTNQELADGLAPRFVAEPPAIEPAPDLSEALPAPLPDFIAPMLATAVDAGFDDPDWLFEVKWDGYRVEAVVGDGRVRLWTRNRTDAAAYFPDLAGRPAWIDAREAVVDGEVVALDDQGRPSFSLLQDRTGLRGLEIATRRRAAGGPRPSAEERAAIPIAYLAFDLLHLDGQSLIRVPLESRKRLLRSVLRPHPLVRYASHVVGEGREFLRAAADQGLEGIVAKRRTGIYQPGQRSRDWLKVKLRREQEVVLAGWLPGQASGVELGSLIAAVVDQDRLRHVGQVGSGIDERDRAALLAALVPLRREISSLDPTPPLPEARWVEPRLVAQVEFSDWTSDGLLRQASFKGLEPDRDPAQVHREETLPVARLLGQAVPSRTPGWSAEPPQAATNAELAALEQMGTTGTWSVAGHQLRLTNLDKVLFPAGGAHPALTKRDLIRYYTQIGPTLVPHLRGRALNLQRFPDGIGRPGFWQKDLPGHTPAWVQRWRWTSSEGPKDYVVVDRVATLAWLAQEGAVELHPWTAPTDAPDRPSFALIDIDPGTSTTFDEVIVLARLFRTALAHLRVTGLPKVTGKRGLQIWIPIHPTYTFDQTRAWVESVSRAVGALVPDLVSWEWAKADRAGRARLDYTQNAPIRTLVAPYSVRPAPGAPVSAPIGWEELDDPQLAPDRWTIRSILGRVAGVGDLFVPATRVEQDLPNL